MTALQEGAALLIGTVSPAGEPRAARAWGIRFVTDARVRVIVAADDDVVVANLRDGLVAITGADVRTLQSTQLKGRVALIEPPSEDDLEMSSRHTDLMFTAIWETDRTEFELQRRVLPRHLIAVEVDLAASFDQTPGPDAGVPLGSRP